MPLRKKYTANPERLASLRSKRKPVSVLTPHVSTILPHASSTAYVSAANTAIPPATNTPSLPDYTEFELEDSSLSPAPSIVLHPSGNKSEHSIIENPNADVPVDSIEAGDQSRRTESHGSDFIWPPRLLYSREPGPYPKPQEVRYAVVVEPDQPNNATTRRVRYTELSPSDKRASHSISPHAFHVKRYWDAVNRPAEGIKPLSPVSPIIPWQGRDRDKSQPTPAPDVILFDPKTVLPSGKLAENVFTPGNLLKRREIRRGKHGFSDRQQKTFEKRQAKYMEAERQRKDKAARDGFDWVEVPASRFVHGYTPGRRTRVTNEHDYGEDESQDGGHVHQYSEDEDISDQISNQHPNSTPVPSTPSSAGAIWQGGRNMWRIKVYGEPDEYIVSNVNDPAWEDPIIRSRFNEQRIMSPPFTRPLPDYSIQISSQHHDEYWKARFQVKMEEELGFDMNYQDPNTVDYPTSRSPSLEAPESPIKVRDSRATLNEKSARKFKMARKRREINKNYFQKKWDYLKTGLLTKAMYRNFKPKLINLKRKIDAFSETPSVEGKDQKLLREAKYRVAKDNYDLMKLRHKRNTNKLIENEKAWQHWLESYVEEGVEEQNEIYKKLGVSPIAKVDGGAFGAIVPLRHITGRTKATNGWRYEDVPIVAKIGPRSSIDRERRFLEYFKADKHPNIVEIFTEYEPAGGLSTTRFTAILLRQALRSSMTCFLFNYNYRKPMDRLPPDVDRSFGNLVPEHIFWDLLGDAASGLAYLHFGVKEVSSGDETYFAHVSQRLWSPVFHGDIKEDNILIDWDRGNSRYKAVLADFGTVDYHFSDYYDGSGAEYLSSYKIRIATDDYIPPEYPRVTLYWDVWSLGATFHSALTNHPPRHRHNPSITEAQSLRKTQHDAIAIFPIHGDLEEWSRFETQHHVQKPPGSEDKYVADIQRTRALSYHLHRLLGIGFNDIYISSPLEDRIPGIAYRPHILLALEEIKADQKKIMDLFSSIDGKAEHEVPDDLDYFANYVNRLITHRDADLDTLVQFHNSEQRAEVGGALLSQHVDIDTIFAHVLGGEQRSKDFTPTQIKRKHETLEEPLNELQTMLQRKTQADAKNFVKKLAQTVMSSRKIVEEQSIHEILNTVIHLDGVWMSTKLDCLDVIKTALNLDGKIPRYYPDEQPPKKLKI
jgi:serine/threonine protein kinase